VANIADDCGLIKQKTQGVTLWRENPITAEQSLIF
jgi:hypothetical protein